MDDECACAYDYNCDEDSNSDGRNSPAQSPLSPAQPRSAPLNSPLLLELIVSPTQLAYITHAQLLFNPRMRRNVSAICLKGASSAEKIVIADSQDVTSPPPPPISLSVKLNSLSLPSYQLSTQKKCRYN